MAVKIALKICMLCGFFLRQLLDRNFSKFTISKNKIDFLLFFLYHFYFLNLFNTLKYSPLYATKYIFLTDMNKISLTFLLTSFLIIVSQCRWTQQKAWDWYNKFNWSAGVNYIPAYAVNEIEMWDSFDLNAIDKEIRWANQIGFSKFRTFLHIEPFLNNRSEFIKNIWKYLAILKSYNSQAILVLFDDCWNPTYKSGKQPDPIPGIHNSQWVQCPGEVKHPEAVYKDYVVTILRTFAQSENVAFWDLYNQVGNSDHYSASLPLLKNIFAWARFANPLQPLTSGKWNGGQKFNQINDYILNESDIITFHAYCDVQCTQNWINDMKKQNRPVVCTEYMARLTNSKFVTHLPVFKQEKVWAINWGFVFGRTQTYYPWGSKEGSPVPEVWFHDVLHSNGTAFDPVETSFIRNITTI